MRDQDFADYREGGEFSTFVRATNHEWVKLAQSIMNKLGAPPTIDVEDVVQEMLIACVRFAFEWDPTRGPSLLQHVQWRAIDKATKFVHRERRSGRESPKKPRSGSPRFDLCFSSFLRPGEEYPEDFSRRLTPTRAAAYLPFQESATVAARVAEHPVVAIFMRERCAARTAEQVLEDQGMRERYKVRSIETAKRDVLKIVRDVVAEAAL